MATVSKTWTFTADNEGLVDAGVSAISVANDSAGNPPRSLEFIGAAGGGNTAERARRAATGETWETWGVPAGATVTSVQILSWDRRKWNATPSNTVTMRILGSAGTSIHSAGDLISAAIGAGNDLAWTANAAGTARAINAGSQVSTTDVRLEVGIQLSAASAAYDLGIDNIVLEITYTPAASGPAKMLASMGVG